MKDISLFTLAEKVGLSKGELAEGVIAYVRQEVGHSAADQLREMLPKRSTPRSQKTLTVKARQSAKPSVTVRFSAPKKESDKKH